MCGKRDICTRFTIVTTCHVVVARADGSRGVAFSAEFVCLSIFPHDI